MGQCTLHMNADTRPSVDDHLLIKEQRALEGIFGLCRDSIDMLLIAGYCLYDGVQRKNHRQLETESRCLRCLSWIPRLQ